MYSLELKGTGNNSNHDAGLYLIVLQCLQSLNMATEKFCKHDVYRESNAKTNKRSAATIATAGSIVDLYKTASRVLGPIVMVEYFLGFLVVTSAAFFGTRLFGAVVTFQFDVQSTLNSNLD